MKKVAVCIHGAGGGGWEYDVWKPVFVRAGWEFVAPDLVPAPGGLAHTSFDDYARQVQAWLPHTPAKLVLVGASMGGVFALRAAMAAQKTGRPLSALVLVNSVAPAGVGPKGKAQSYPAVVKWANGPLQETRDALTDSDEKTIRWAWKKWRDESGAVMNTLGQGVVVTKPTCPVLSLLGDKDTDVPFVSGLALAQWANADVQIYHNMSHVGPLMSRRAEEVAQNAVRWIEKRTA